MIQSESSSKSRGTSNPRTAPEAARDKLCELDPGMKYTLRDGSTDLAEIVVIDDESTITEYFTLWAALPSDTTSITIAAAVASSPPPSYTFSVTASPFSGPGTAPSSSASLFVNTTSHVGLVWSFSEDGGKWSGSVTWYNDSSSNISIADGTTVTLTNNTYDSSLTYSATNAPSD